MEEWYYTRDGQQQGPVNLETLRQMASSGELKREDMVWNRTMTNWVPSSEVDGIHTASSAAASGAAAVTPTLAPGAAPPPLNKSWADDPELREIEPGSDPLDIGGVINHTLALTKKHFVPLLLLGLVTMGVSFALSMISQVFMSIGGAILDAAPPPQPTMDPPESFEDVLELLNPTQSLVPAMIGVYIVMQVITSVVNLYISLGMTRACLNLVEGKESNISMLFGEASKILKAVGASIVCFAFVMVGLLCLIIPGIYLAIRLSVVIPAIVDRNMGVFEAISYSFKITKGNGGQIFLLWLIGVVLMIIAILITCGLGVIVAGPVFTLGWVICYRWMQYGRRVTQ